MQEPEQKNRVEFEVRNPKAEVKENPKSDLDRRMHCGGRNPKTDCGRGSLQIDLEQLRKLAFRRAEHCGELVKRFWGMEKQIGSSPDGELIWKVYDWLVTPLSLWPIDFEGLAGYVLEQVEHGKGLDEEMKILLRVLESPPGRETQEAVAEFEHYVQSGRYEELLRQPEKFQEQDRAVTDDEELKSTWMEIKQRFETAGFRNTRGVIRRRMSQERNFRESWKFEWSEMRGRFQVLFDAMCHRWKLYGMEWDRPLSLKVSVNPTPHGTMIFIPRHWSLDPHRDLDWGFIGKLHRARGARKQGPKLSAGRIGKVEEARLARKLWSEAGRRGLRGEARYEFVRERMRKDVRMDAGWLKRLLRPRKLKADS